MKKWGRVKTGTPHVVANTLKQQDELLQVIYSLRINCSITK